MPPKRNDGRPPKRAAYRDVGARARQSRERALAGGATPAELAVLGAVFHWIVTFSKTGDYVSLGRLAQAAGMWDGEAEDCPRYVEKRVAQRLRRLEEMRALVYSPGGQHGRGDASRVGLPKVEEGDFLTGRVELGTASIAARKGGALSTPLPDGERGSTPRSEGEQSVRERGSKTCTKGGALSTPHTRSLRGGSEESSERTRARSSDDVARLAALLTERTTGAAPDAPREAERTVELLLECGAEPDDIDDAIDDLEPGALDDPVELVTAFAGNLGAHVLDHPGYRALVHGGALATIIEASPGHWLEHAEEAHLVVDHWRRHDLPDHVLEDALAEAERARLKRPGHANEIARRIAADLGIDLPRLDLPPARKIPRRPT